jgi:hypothetical protein
MSYLVRVELHEAQVRDYQNLHVQMESRGFRQVIRGDNGNLYHLPTAEYVIDTLQSGEQVRALADSAAGASGKPHAVLVVDYARAWWSGLSQVRAA